jgi:hypothetical protein
VRRLLIGLLQDFQVQLFRLGEIARRIQLLGVVERLRDAG